MLMIFRCLLLVFVGTTASCAEKSAEKSTEKSDTRAANASAEGTAPVAFTFTIRGPAFPEPQVFAIPGDSPALSLSVSELSMNRWLEASPREFNELTSVAPTSSTIWKAPSMSGNHIPA
jgi:hypothetical protein